LPAPSDLCLKNWAVCVKCKRDARNPQDSQSSVLDCGGFISRIRAPRLRD
jgi:hypothetical protein